MTDMSVTSEIMIGTCVPGYHDRWAFSELDEFRKLRMGNFVGGLRLPAEKAKAIELAKYCRKHRLYFTFAEERKRSDVSRETRHTKQDIEEIISAAGEFCRGFVILGEVGGLLYWPKEYVIKGAVGEYVSLPRATDVRQAKENYLDFLRERIAVEKRLGKKPLLNVDSSILHKYHLEAGIDTANLEVFPGDTDQMLAALRGASRAYGRKDFSLHVVFDTYGGSGPLDELWLKRWKTSLYRCYLAGANFIYAEKGLYGIYSRGNNVDPESAECRRARKTLSDFYAWCRKHPRPRSGPKTPVGIVHGNLDGYSGLWNTRVWGQTSGKQWERGDAERGWELVAEMHRRAHWSSNTNVGAYDFTGNPPDGEFDIVPIEAPQKVLNRYRCLVFLGWNTMTDAIYDKLKTYVRRGGRLFMSVAHLSTHVDRRKDLELYRDGDFRDLFGARVLGKGATIEGGVKFVAESLLRSYAWARPLADSDPSFIAESYPVARVETSTATVLAVKATTWTFAKDRSGNPPLLLQNRIGKGVAHLITSWCYPGHPAMRLFMKNLLRTIIVGEQTDLRVIATDRLRYAVYEDEGRTKIFLVNTDPDLPCPCKIIHGDLTRTLEIEPTGARVVSL